MTSTELVEAIVRFYQTPGNSRGFSPTGSCQYQINAQSKCVIGCLVTEPDQIDHFVDWLVGDGDLETVFNHAKASSIYEEEESRVLAVKVYDMIQSILPTDIQPEYRAVGFLHQLQQIHDRSERSESVASFVKSFDLEARRLIEKFHASSKLEGVPLQ